jgi:hypothetical protein
MPKEKRLPLRLFIVKSYLTEKQTNTEQSKLKHDRVAFPSWQLR